MSLLKLFSVLVRFSKFFYAFFHRFEVNRVGSKKLSRQLVSSVLKTDKVTYNFCLIEHLVRDYLFFIENLELCYYLTAKPAKKPNIKFKDFLS